MMKDGDLNSGATDQTAPSSGMNSQASANSSTNADTKPKPTNEADKRKAVADLFKAKAEPEPKPEPGQDVEPKPEPREPEPWDTQLWDGRDAPEPEPAPSAAREKLTPQSLAEKLDTDAATIYKMDVPLSDGTTAKLSELKDLWQGREAARAEIAAKAAGLNGREAQIIADQRVWSELAINGNLPPDALDRVRTQIANQHRREQALLFDLVPELKDETKLDLFRNDVVRVLGSVGYQPHQVVIQDHRQALFVRRYVQMERELTALREAAKPKPPKARQGNGRPLTPAKPQRPLGHRDATVAAVSDILNGK